MVNPYIVAVDGNGGLFGTVGCRFRRIVNFGILARAIAANLSFVDVWMTSSSSIGKIINSSSTMTLFLTKALVDIYVIYTHAVRVCNIRNIRNMTLYHFVLIYIFEKRRS